MPATAPSPARRTLATAALATLVLAVSAAPAPAVSVSATGATGASPNVDRGRLTVRLSYLRGDRRAITVRWRGRVRRSTELALFAYPLVGSEDNESRAVRVPPGRRTVTVTFRDRPLFARIDCASATVTDVAPGARRSYSLGGTREACLTD